MARVPLTRVVPIQNIVPSNDVGEIDDEEHLNSTPADIFAVENELTVFPNQNERSIFAEAVFGDISLFLHNSNDFHELPPPPDGSTDEENGVESSLAGAGSLPGCVEISNDVTIEIPRLPENVGVVDAANAGQLELDPCSSSIGVEDVETSNTVIEIPQLPEIDEEVRQEPTGQKEHDVHASGELSTPISNIKYKPSVYIHAHIDMMYIFGACNYRTLIQNSSNEHEGYWGRTVSWIHTAFFAAIVVLSILQYFFDAKYHLMRFLAGAGLNTLVKLTFCLISLVSSVYGAYIFGWKGNKITKMVQVIREYENTWEEKPMKPAFSFILATVTVVFAALKALWIIDLDEISTENILLENSYELSEDLFVWSSQDKKNTSLQLEKDYGTSLNCITSIMGIVYTIRSFASVLFQGMIWDIFANIVLTMLCYMMSFMTSVHLVMEMEDIPDENSEQAIMLKQKRSMVWSMYREIRKLFEVVNEVFDQLLMLFHSTNVLRYAFFLEKVMYPDGATAFTYIHLLYDIVKSEAIYVTASKIAKQNAVIRQWIRAWALQTGKIDIDCMQMDANMVIDEIKEEQIGVGRGDLLIHQGFHHGLLGRVFSLFVILANKTGETI